VIIPTYNRGLTVTRALKKIDKCDPKPAEIWTHIDLSDGTLEGVLREQFPDVRVLTSPVRLGPGGGRHRCLVACGTPYAVSFDDDSYPVDPDFFFSTERLFCEYPRAAIFGARIWHRHECEKVRTASLVLNSELYRMWLCYTPGCRQRSPRISSAGECVRYGGK